MMFILLKGPKIGLATGVKVEICLSVMEELVGPGEAIFPPLSMLKMPCYINRKRRGNCLT